MSTNPTEHGKPTDATTESSESFFDGALADIERGMANDDPAFVRRLQRLKRADDANAATIFALLLLSVVLLAVGLATISWLPWIAGALAFITAFAVDDRCRRWTRASHTSDQQPF